MFFFLKSFIFIRFESILFACLDLSYMICGVGKAFLRKIIVFFGQNQRCRSTISKVRFKTYTVKVVKLNFYFDCRKEYGVTFCFNYLNFVSYLNQPGNSLLLSVEGNFSLCSSIY